MNSSVPYFNPLAAKIASLLYFSMASCAPSYHLHPSWRVSWGGHAPVLHCRLRAAQQTRLAAGAIGGMRSSAHPVAPGTAPVRPQCLHKQLRCQECANGVSLRGAAKICTSFSPLQTPPA